MEGGTSINLCTACEKGFYADKAGSTVCSKCDGASYSDHTAAVNCTLCPAGYQMNYGDQPHDSFQHGCNPCNEGAYSPTAGSSTCTACEPGRYQDKPISTSCTLCAAGKANIDKYGRSESVCEPCERGKISSQDGASTCSECTAGHFSNVTGLSACYDCDEGKYQSGTYPTLCMNCPTGKYANETASTECSYCDAGRFANDTGLPDCYPCSPGYAQGTRGESTCTLCEYGTFSPAGSISCINCQKGRYNPHYVQSSCRLCPSGRFNYQLGSTSIEQCFNCTQGRSSDAGSSTCADCLPGTFSNHDGSPKCFPCEVGTYSEVPRAFNCTRCPAGTHNPDTGSQSETSCLACELGHFSRGGVALCSKCSPGTFSDTKGETGCKNCATGSFSNSEGAEICKLCEVGRYTDKEKSLSCEECEKGTFSSVQGASHCEDCEPGTFNGNTGQSVCNDCPAGTFNVDEASTSDAACVKCWPGTYGTEVGAPSPSACLSCGKGRFSPDSGEINCTQCIAGTYANHINSTHCDQCPFGTFSAIPGAQSFDTCQSCPVGRYGPAIGETTCEYCEGGTYNDHTKATSISACAACVPGQYSFRGASSCTPCEKGRYASDPGTENCKKCEPGRFNPNTGSLSYHDCTECPAGRFSNTSGSSLCAWCPIESRRTVPAGSTECSVCLPKSQLFGYQGIGTLCEYSLLVPDSVVFTLVGIIIAITLACITYAKVDVRVAIVLVLAAGDFSTDLAYALLSDFWHPLFPYICLFLILGQIVPFMYIFRPCEALVLFVWHRAPMLPLPKRFFRKIGGGENNDDLLRQPEGGDVDGVVPIEGEGQAVYAPPHRNNGRVGAGEAAPQVEGHGAAEVDAAAANANRNDGVNQKNERGPGDVDDNMWLLIGSVLYTIIFWCVYLAVNSLLFALNFILWPLCFYAFANIGLFFFLTKLLVLPKLTDWYLRIWNPVYSTRNNEVVLEDFNRILVVEILCESLPQLVIQLLNNRSDYSSLAIVSLMFTLLSLVAHGYKFVYHMVKLKTHWLQVPTLKVPSSTTEGSGVGSASTASLLNAADSPVPSYT